MEHDRQVGRNVGKEGAPPPEDSEKKPTGRTDQLKARAGDLGASLGGLRDSSTTVGAGFYVAERNREFPLSFSVGAVVNRLIIFLIPFLFFAIFALGLGADQASVDVADVATDAGMPQLFAAAVSDSGAASAGLQGFALVFTAFAMVWTANGLGQTLWRAVSLQWGVPLRRPHPKWAVPVVVIVVAFLTMGVYSAGSRFDQLGHIDIGVRLGEFLAVAGMWLVVSRLLPRDPDADRWRDLIPGAVLAGLAIIAMKAAMVLYLIPKWGTLSERYGDIGIILVMLSWAYLVGLVAVSSASINAAVFYSHPDSADFTGWRSWPLPNLLRTRWRDRQG